jgi:hypothetical protein
VITNRYKLRTSSEVGDHRRQLQTKQRSDERIQVWWIGITIAVAYMQAAGRNISNLGICNIVKDNALYIHSSWASHVDPLVTSRDELEDLIYNRGVHLEEKVAASQLEKSGPIAFPATREVGEKFRILQEKLAALST